MQIQLCISDPELSDAEKTAVALSLLYGNGVPPDIQTALDGLSWFLNCGAEPSGEDGAQEETVYSFEYDAGRIASAFRKVFGLDITRQRLHWFEFIPMLGDLNGTAFTGVSPQLVGQVERISTKVKPSLFICFWKAVLMAFLALFRLGMSVTHTRSA